MEGGWEGKGRVACFVLVSGWLGVFLYGLGVVGCFLVLVLGCLALFFSCIVFELVRGFFCVLLVLGLVMGGCPLLVSGLVARRWWPGVCLCVSWLGKRVRN